MSDDKVVELRGSGLWSPDEIFDGAKEIFDGAKERWRHLVAAVEDGHFAREDSPWLAEYCLAIALSNMAHKEVDAGGMLPHGKTSPWVTVTNRQVANMILLSTRLHLNPQSSSIAPRKRSSWRRFRRSTSQR